jgi:glutathione S-transferase
MLTFIHAPRSRSTRILWLLEELGVPYDLKIVSIKRGDGTGAPDSTNKHPFHKVPALIHDGALIYETPAIAQYLTDLFPEKKLAPRIGDPARGPYVTWLAYSTGVLEPSLMMARLGVKHVPGAMGWGPKEDVEAHLNAALGTSPYFLGDDFSAVDIVMGGSVAFMMQFGMMAETPVLKSYAARIQSRPAFARSQAKDVAA